MGEVTVTISIGRNVGDQPMPASEWRKFRAHVRDSLALCGGCVHVDAAHSVGEWDGKPEDSATWVAAIPADTVEELRVDLRLFCAIYDQDAIALTIGDTDLVSR